MLGSELAFLLVFVLAFGLGIGLCFGLRFRLDAPIHPSASRYDHIHPEWVQDGRDLTDHIKNHWELLQFAASVQQGGPTRTLRRDQSSAFEDGEQQVVWSAAASAAASAASGWTPFAQGGSSLIAAAVALD